MCGIVGFTGCHQAAPILLDGLSKLDMIPRVLRFVMAKVRQKSLRRKDV